MMKINKIKIWYSYNKLAKVIENLLVLLIINIIKNHILKKNHIVQCQELSNKFIDIIIIKLIMIKQSTIMICKKHKNSMFIKAKYKNNK